MPRAERGVAPFRPQAARDAAPLPAPLDEEIEHMAALAHADETGQLTLHDGHVADQAAAEPGVQADFIVVRQKMRGALGRRFGQDEFQGGAAQQRGGRRDADRVEWADDHGVHER